MKFLVLQEKQNHRKVFRLYDVNILINVKLLKDLTSFIIRSYSGGSVSCNLNSGNINKNRF